MPVVVLDPAWKSANITLTGGNLIATLTGTVTSSAARCGTPYRSSTYPARYMEVTLTNHVGTTTPVLSIMPAANYTSSSLNTTFATVIRPNAGVWTTYRNGTLDFASAVAPSTGQVIGIVLNNQAATVAFYAGGTLVRTVAQFGNPITDLVFAASLSTAAEAVTVNFGATAFTYAPPAGSIPWQDDKFHAVLGAVHSPRPVYHLGL